MAKWLGARYNQEVRFSSAVNCKKGPQLLTSLLNQRKIIVIIIAQSTKSYMYSEGIVTVQIIKF